MKQLINKLFPKFICNHEHEWELIHKTHIIDNFYNDDFYNYYKFTYACKKKCGKLKFKTIK